MPVIGKACGAKDRETIEKWQDLLLGVAHFPIPQLEVSAVFFLPVFVQIDQHIDSTVQLELRVKVEIRMHLERATRFDLVQSAAHIVRVGDNALDACERLKKL